MIAQPNAWLLLHSIHKHAFAVVISHILFAVIAIPIQAINGTSEIHTVVYCHTTEYKFYRYKHLLHNKPPRTLEMTFTVDKLITPTSLIISSSFKVWPQKLKTYKMNYGSLNIQSIFS